MKYVLKKVASVALALLLLAQSLALVACDDLGSYDDPENKRGDEYEYNEKLEMELYYAAYGTVLAYHTDDDEIYSYDIQKSLYNATTKNEMTWGDGDVPVEPLAYIYVAIPVKQNLLIDDLALFFKVHKFYSLRNPEILDDYREETKLYSWSSTVDLFLLSDESQLPTGYKKFGQPFTEEVQATDEEGNPAFYANGEPIMEEVPIEYGDLDPATAIATVKTTFERNSWNSIFFSDWWDRSDPEKPIQKNYFVASEGEIIVLRFEGNQQNDIKTVFQFIDLMIRSV